MPNLRLSCFQSTQVWLDGEPLTHFPRVKALALLIYLAVEQDRPHQRNALAGLLWPDSPEARARRNLSQTLMDLRRTLGDAGDGQLNEPPFLLTATQTIAFNPDCEQQIDVIDFVAAMKNDNHAQAVALYRGPFLAEFEALDSDLFESWVETQRENLHRQALDAFRKLSLEHEQQGELEQAQQVVNQLLAMAPWQEESHAQLMRLLALSGERTAALAQYDTLSEILMDELGVSPSDETNTLYDQILAGELTSLSSPSPTLEGSNRGYPLTLSPPQLPIPFQVTASSPHFVGRDAEIEQIRELLNQPGSTVIALVGMGGLGKTTLAAQVAHAVRDDFPDGILWANPAISSVMDILDNWGKAYGYDFSGLSDIESRGAALRGVLAEKSELLVLDNVTNAAQVRPMLVGGDGSPMLITTRDLDVAHALNAEVIPLGELSAGSGRDLLVNILGKERVEAEEEEADQICQLLHYLPLAVEIAAQRLKSRARMPLSQMAQRLSDTGQRLGLKISDQAVRTSFEVSWEALDEELQAFFPLLAVFEGRPFTAEALAYVADMDEFDVEDLLYGLNALSLVQEDETAYFRQHPLLADFAREKLDRSTVHQQHETIAELTGEKLLNADYAVGRLVEYYLAFVVENQQNYFVLEPEWGNIGAVIETAYSLEAWEKVIEFTDALEKTWITLARYGDARNIYRLAHYASLKLENESIQATNLVRWGEICTELGDYEEAKPLLDQSLSLSYHIESGEDIARVHYLQARIAIDQGNYEEAEQALSECQSIFQGLEDKPGLSVTAYWKSRLYFDYGPDYNAAEQWALQALAYQETNSEPFSLIETIRHIAQIKVEKEEYADALAYGERAVALSQDAGYPIELGAAQYCLTPIYRKLDRLPEALGLAENALSIFKQHGDRRFEAMILYQMSQIYKLDNQLHLAVEAANQSLQIFQHLDFQLGCAYVLQNLGEVYAKLNQDDDAKTTLLEARSIAYTIDHSILLQSIDEHLSQCPT